MNLWILVIHKPLIVKFYKSKYHSASLRVPNSFFVEGFEHSSIWKQVLWLGLVSKNINFLFFHVAVKVHHSGRSQT